MLILLQKITIKNPFADISPEDRKVLLICLGIAFVFWILVKLSKDYTARSHVHIFYELPFGTVFTNPPPNTIALDLKAKGWYFFLKSLTGREPKLVYQIPSTATSYSLSVIKLREDLTSILKDRDAAIVNLHFEGIDLLLEKQANKHLPIVLRTDIEFAPEYDLAKTIRISPDSITIVGPKSRLDFLVEWPTDTLRVKGLNQDYEGVLPISLPDERFGVSFKEVSVFVAVERYTEKNIYVPIELNQEFDDSIRFFPEKIELKCVIGLSYYNDLSASDFIIKADLTEHLIQEGKSTVALELVKQPDFVRNTQFFPKVASFFIINPN